MVGLKGFEPSRVAPLVSKTSVSAVPPQAEIIVLALRHRDYPVLAVANSGTEI
jgi:hypothetical protein